MNEILLTGGSGLLGTELHKYIACYAPSHKEMDVTEAMQSGPYELVIHAAAYTDVIEAETHKKDCFSVNVVGTYHMAMAYWDVPFVYISTEYVKNPLNTYARSKLIGEKIVEAVCDRYLIIRTLFKPYPFPHDKAFTDQYTTGDYVTVIAPMIVDAIFAWNKQESKIVDIGTGRKTMYDLAKQSNPAVGKVSVDTIGTVRIPKDYL